MLGQVFILITWLCLSLMPFFAYAQGNVQVWSPRGPANPKESTTTNEMEDSLPKDGKESIGDEAAVERPKDPNAELGQVIDANLVALQAAIDKGATGLDIVQDPKLRQNLIEAFEKNPLSKLPPEELQKQLRKSPLAPMFKKSPKFEKFMTNFMIHPSAISQMARSFNRATAWRNCIGASVAMMILLHLLKKRMTDKNTAWWKGAIVSLCFTMFSITFSVALLLIVFDQELTPTVEVFKQTFFKG